MVWLKYCMAANGGMSVLITGQELRLMSHVDNSDLEVTIHLIMIDF